jgi:uncharacterized protein YdeI (YjbR/CyaY-like superfamily)
VKRFNTVDDYLNGLTHWKPEITRLREVLLTTGLDETIKWGAPCYTYQGKNIVGIGGFKSYFGLWFFQGALLQDKQELLINAQEGRTKAMRQWRMQAMKEIKPAIIKKYVAESIQLVDAGKEIKADRAKPLVVPAELERAFQKHKRARTIFQGFTIGKQREYAEYIADAKQAATKSKRIEKIMPMILDGMGLNDKYK